MGRVLSGQVPQGSPFPLRAFPGAYSSPGIRPPGAGADASPEVTMDVTVSATGITPDGGLVPVDGAVAELTEHGDGTVTAEIRIPGPPVP